MVFLPNLQNPAPTRWLSVPKGRRRHAGIKKNPFLLFFCVFECFSSLIPFSGLKILKKQMYNLRSTNHLNGKKRTTFLPLLRFGFVVSRNDELRLGLRCGRFVPLYCTDCDAVDSFLWSWVCLVGIGGVIGSVIGSVLWFVRVCVTWFWYFGLVCGSMQVVIFVVYVAGLRCCSLIVWCEFPAPVVVHVWICRLMVEIFVYWLWRFGWWKLLWNFVLGFCDAG